MYWRDLELPRWPGEWQGLELTVERGDLPPRPPWRIEAAPWTYLRASDAGGPLLWARKHNGAEGLWWLRAERTPAPVVPPILASDLRASASPAHGQSWWSGWARWFADALVRSSSTPLHPARWALAASEHRAKAQPTLLPARRHWDAIWASVWHLMPATLEYTLDAASYRWTSWIGGAGHVVRLHPPPAKNAARVRAWRRRARDGTLPPILVMLARGMGLWLLLDGHLRLAAALEEGVAVPMLHLFVATYPPCGPHTIADPDMRRLVHERLEAERASAAELRPGFQLDNLQRLIVTHAEEETLVPSTHAWPIDGGHLRWHAEVTARLASLGLPADHALARGLTPYEARRLGSAV